jgi:hypothetical protein
MDSVYDLHSWSKQYREERLTEARVRHLVERTRRSSLSSSWRNPLALLRAVASWK